jgi:hypothetical protein
VKGERRKVKGGLLCTGFETNGYGISVKEPRDIFSKSQGF